MFDYLCLEFDVRLTGLRKRRAPQRQRGSCPRPRPKECWALEHPDGWWHVCQWGLWTSRTSAVGPTSTDRREMAYTAVVRSWRAASWPFSCFI